MIWLWLNMSLFPVGLFPTYPTCKQNYWFDDEKLEIIYQEDEVYLSLQSHLCASWWASVDCVAPQFPQILPLETISGHAKYIYAETLPFSTEHIAWGAGVLLADQLRWWLSWSLTHCRKICDPPKPTKMRTNNSSRLFLLQRWGLCMLIAALAAAVFVRVLVCSFSTCLLTWKCNALRIAS